MGADIKKSKSKQAIAKVRNRPCKLKGFLIECGSRAPEDVPKSKLAKAKAGVAITCSLLTEYDVKQFYELPDPIQSLAVVEDEIIDRLLAELGVNGYRAEAQNGLLVYQDVRNDTRIAQHIRGEKLVVFASPLRRVDFKFCITRHGCGLDVPKCPPVIATLCLILEDVYRLRHDLVEKSVGQRSVALGMRLMERLTQIRADIVYTHLSRPDNVRKKAEAHERYRREAEVYQQAAEQAREVGLSPNDSGVSAVQEWRKTHPEVKSADGARCQAVPALDSIKKDLSRWRQIYGAVPVCVSHKAKPWPKESRGKRGFPAQQHNAAAGHRV